MPRTRDLAILVLTTDKTDHFTPLAHARGLIEKKAHGGVCVHFGSPLWPLIGCLLPALGFYYPHTLNKISCFVCFAGR